MITKDRIEFECEAERRLADASGTTLAVEVDWESFERAPFTPTSLESRALPQLGSALREICAERGWRDTVRERLRRIVILPSRGGRLASAVMSGGTLSLRIAPGAVPSTLDLKAAFSAAS